MTTISQTRLSAWLPAALGLAALAALGYGVVQAIGLAARPGPQPGAVSGPPDATPTPVAGVKGPRNFGLPEFPGAREFASMETTVGIGSTTYAVRAEADEVSRFYLREMGKLGWDLVWRRKATMRTSPNPEVKPLTGTRIRWAKPAEKRQLTLLTTWNPYRKLAHVVLSWSPLEVVAGTGSHPR